MSRKKKDLPQGLESPVKKQKRGRILKEKEDEPEQLEVGKEIEQSQEETNTSESTSAKTYKKEEKVEKEQLTEEEEKKETKKKKPKTKRKKMSKKKEKELLQEEIVEKSKEIEETESKIELNKVSSPISITNLESSQGVQIKSSETKPTVEESIEGKIEIEDIDKATEEKKIELIEEEIKFVFEEELILEKSQIATIETPLNADEKKYIKAFYNTKEYFDTLTSIQEKPCVFIEQPEIKLQTQICFLCEQEIPCGPYDDFEKISNHYQGALHFGEAYLIKDFYGNKNIKVLQYEELDTVDLLRDYPAIVELPTILNYNAEKEFQFLLEKVTKSNKEIRDYQIGHRKTMEINKFIPEKIASQGPNDLTRFLLQSHVIPEKDMVYVQQNLDTTQWHIDDDFSIGMNIMLYGEFNYFLELKDKYRTSAIWWFLDQSQNEMFFSFCRRHGTNILHGEKNEKFTPQLFLHYGFRFYFTIQHPGDLIIVPPNCVHAVQTYGPTCIKYAYFFYPKDLLHIYVEQCINFNRMHKIKPKIPVHLILLELLNNVQDTDEYEYYNSLLLKLDSNWDKAVENLPIMEFAIHYCDTCLQFIVYMRHFCITCNKELCNLCITPHKENQCQILTSLLIDKSLMKQKPTVLKPNAIAFVWSDKDEDIVSKFLTEKQTIALKSGVKDGKVCITFKTSIDILLSFAKYEKSNIQMEKDITKIDFEKIGNIWMILDEKDLEGGIFIIIDKKKILFFGDISIRNKIIKEINVESFNIVGKEIHHTVIIIAFLLIKKKSIQTIELAVNNDYVLMFSKFSCSQKLLTFPKITEEEKKKRMEDEKKIEIEKKNLDFKI